MKAFKQDLVITFLSPFSYVFECVSSLFFTQKGKLQIRKKEELKENVFPSFEGDEYSRILTFVNYRKRRKKIELYELDFQLKISYLSFCLSKNTTNNVNETIEKA